MPVCGIRKQLISWQNKHNLIIPWILSNSQKCFFSYLHWFSPLNAFVPAISFWTLIVCIPCFGWLHITRSDYYIDIHNWNENSDQTRETNEQKKQRRQLLVPRVCVGLCVSETSFVQFKEGQSEIAWIDRDASKGNENKLRFNTLMVQCRGQMSWKSKPNCFRSPFTTYI